MSEQNPPDEVKQRLAKVASGYAPKLSPRQTFLFPFKTQIRELRARQAAYDDIRLILAKEKIMVSLNTLYRFCRDVIGEKSACPYKTRTKKNPSAKVSPALPLAEKTGVALPQQPEAHERYDGPWSKKKNVPRIANPKNL